MIFFKLFILWKYKKEYEIYPEISLGLDQSDQKI